MSTPLSSEQMTSIGRGVGSLECTLNILNNNLLDFQKEETALEVDTRILNMIQDKALQPYKETLTGLQSTFEDAKKELITKGKGSTPHIINMNTTLKTVFAEHLKCVDIETIMAKHQHYGYQQVLFDLIAKDYLDEARTLIKEHKLDVNKCKNYDGKNIFLQVISQCKLNTVVFLIDEGADVTGEQMVKENPRANRPLEWACHYNGKDSYAIVQLLIDHGASVNQVIPTIPAISLLDLTIRSNHKRMIALLIFNGVDVDFSAIPDHWKDFIQQMFAIRYRAITEINNAYKDSLNPKIKGPVEAEIERALPMIPIDVLKIAMDYGNVNTILHHEILKRCQVTEH